MFELHDPFLVVNRCREPKIVEGSVLTRPTPEFLRLRASTPEPEQNAQQVLDALGPSDLCRGDGVIHVGPLREQWTQHGRRRGDAGRFVCDPLHLLRLDLVGLLLRALLRRAPVPVTVEHELLVIELAAFERAHTGRIRRPAGRAMYNPQRRNSVAGSRRLTAGGRSRFSRPT
jgi:hypothetical protein